MPAVWRREAQQRYKRSVRKVQRDPLRERNKTNVRVARTTGHMLPLLPPRKCKCSRQNETKQKKKKKKVQKEQKKKMWKMSVRHPNILLRRKRSRLIERPESRYGSKCVVDPSGEGAGNEKRNLLCYYKWRQRVAINVICPSPCLCSFVIFSMSNFYEQNQRQHI